MRTAMCLQGKTNVDLANQRVVCVGAGSAGLGVVRMIALGVCVCVCVCVHVCVFVCVAKRDPSYVYAAFS